MLKRSDKVLGRQSLAGKPQTKKESSIVKLEDRLEGSFQRKEQISGYKIASKDERVTS